MWERFSAGASNQISLMKWVYGVQPDESEATASMPMLPKIALRGNFLLVIDHFISEIADCTQQQKTGPRPVPFPAAAAPFRFQPPRRFLKWISVSENYK